MGDSRLQAVPTLAGFDLAGVWGHVMGEERSLSQEATESSFKVTLSLLIPETRSLGMGRASWVGMRGKRLIPKPSKISTTRWQ